MLGDVPATYVFKGAKIHWNASAFVAVWNESATLQKFITRIETTGYFVNARVQITGTLTRHLVVDATTVYDHNNVADIKNLLTGMAIYAGFTIPVSPNDIWVVQQGQSGGQAGGNPASLNPGAINNANNPPPPEADFLEKYGLWIGVGFAALVLMASFRD